MSKFPSDYDDDTDLPAVNDNLNDIGGEAINALRDFAFNLEQNIGLTAAGTTGSLSARLDVSLFPNGDIKPSAIAGLGLVTLPITDGQISPTAQIIESKLRLDHRTADLFNYIRDLSSDINVALGWISATGIKLEPHILGALYRHSLEDIDVDKDPARFLKNKYNTLRDNSDSYFMLNDLNSELLTHQWADGSPFVTPQPITTFDGSVYPSNYGHTASGIFINTSRFATIPQTADDLQLLAEFIDSSSIFLYGTRIQNLYSNGISKISRSASLVTDGYGAPVIPSTTAITYLLNIGTSSSPVDNINSGDDIIEFKPSTVDVDSNAFDARFALVKVGDIARVNYGTVEVQFVIKEKKYIQQLGNKKYIIRIAGKNLLYTTNASVRIDKPLMNANKYGVLSTAASNNVSLPPSLIVGSPRGAQALGLGFNPDQLDTQHHMLYLALYPTGNPLDGYVILPPIDVTGDKGNSQGLYTLDSIVASTNNAFRQAGYNYRFIAFQYQGEFGIMLADSYGNSGFSIVSAVVDAAGFYDELGTSVALQNNVIGIFSTFPAKAPDPLGFGPFGSNLSSPPFMLVYGSAEAAQNPTKIFLPLKRNNYYVNGIEKEKMNLEIGQALDPFGDGYWVSSILAKNVFPGPNGRVQTTYRIPLDLTTSSLKVGKTLVAQSLGVGGLVNFGRFIIESITFGCLPNVFTDIVVYDAVHGTALSPSTTLDVGSPVAIFFNNDSVSFNSETATDFTSVSPFKRHFEVYVNQEGQTFTHERARINASGSTIIINGTVNLLTYSELQKMSIVSVSPKLRGYQFGTVNKITLAMAHLDNETGIFDGYMCSYDGVDLIHPGPVTFGKIGEVVRFYDETNIDYIDLSFSLNTPISTFDEQFIDFQLFPTLSLDEEIMKIATCQLNDVDGSVSNLKDQRQFGNTSEKEFSTSALEFLSLPERALHSNGVIRGFDLAITDPTPNPFDGYAGQNGGQIYLTGGLALVNGKFIQMNNEMVIIPIIKELHSAIYNVNWILCVNDKGEYQPIPLLDFDPSLDTPPDEDRIFQAFNLVNGTSYKLDATTFSDLVNNRKDLVPLYIVAAITTPGSGPTPAYIALDLSDARKYVNDADTNLPLRLTSADAQGNFKSPVSIFNWIKYNNVFNSTAFVKGADDITGQINSDLILDFGSSAIIDGENNAKLTMNNPVTIGSNLTLKNLTIIFNAGLTMKDNPQNVIFDNCDITIVVPGGVNTPPSNIVFNILNGNNIVIQDCNININFPVQYSPATEFRGAGFHISNTIDFQFINSILSITYNIASGSVTPGAVFWLDGSDGVIIKDSEFSGNFNRFIRNDQSNKLRLNNLKLTSIYCPVNDTFGTGGPYQTSDLINGGQGWFYSNVSSTLDDIVMDNISFNYNPISANLATDRFSFIFFGLTSASSQLSNITITNCKFNNLKASTVGINSYEDIRPAVVIVSTQTNVLTASAQQPIISNINISHNNCNRNQSIIVTSRATAQGKMVYPGLVANNCVIRDNVCGTIGYWTSAGSKTINVNNVNTFSDKTPGLLIENNICHYITNLDQKGQYFQVAKPNPSTTDNFCAYPSGNVIIRGNKANWIHTGISFEESSSLLILDNNLTAYTETYMDSFGDANGSIVQRGHGYAILVLSNKHVTLETHAQALGEGEGNDGTVIITGNTTSTGYWLQTTLTTTVYRYSAGYVYCQSSNNIRNNIFKGVDETSIFGSPTPLILVSGLNNSVSQNKLYRSGKGISSYVAFNSADSPIWDGTGANGMIVDNFFDSPFISDTTLAETTINVPNVSPAFVLNHWVVERNKNQTGYAVCPITNKPLFNMNPSWGPHTVDTGLISYIGPMPDGATLATGPVANSTGSHRSPSVLLRDEETAVNIFWGFQENIEKFLPNNVRILTITQGLRPWESVVTYQTNTALVPAGVVNSNFYLNVSSLDASLTSTNDFTNTGYFTSSSDPDDAIVEKSSPVYDIITGGQINATSSNLFFSINLENYTDPLGGAHGDISYKYLTGRGKNISLSGDWRWKRTSTTMHITLSPILIKYRW